jgi:nucleotide-binding universal stress UspA family protein
VSVSFHTILVGDNGTPEAERAVAVAMSLGEKLGAKVILLGVVPPPSAESQAEGYGLTSSLKARKKLQEQLERTAQTGRQSGIDVAVEIVEGMAEPSIEKTAQRAGADLIVVGRRHISRIRHWLEGSTSECLVRRCPVSVLVVHDVQNTSRASKTPSQTASSPSSKLSDT